MKYKKEIQLLDEACIMMESLGVSSFAESIYTLKITLGAYEIECYGSNFILNALMSFNLAYSTCYGISTDFMNILSKVDIISTRKGLPPIYGINGTEVSVEEVDSIVYQMAKAIWDEADSVE